MVSWCCGIRVHEVAATSLRVIAIDNRDKIQLLYNVLRNCSCFLFNVRTLEQKCVYVVIDYEIAHWKERDTLIRRVSSANSSQADPLSVTCSRTVNSMHTSVIYLRSCNNHTWRESLTNSLQCEQW